MKSEKEHPSNRRERIWTAVCWVSLALCVGLIVFASSGCPSTVVPTTTIAREASWDGNEQSSGIIASTPQGFIVTDNFVDRFELLITIYGGDFAPPLKQTGAVPQGPDRLLITKHAMAQFLTMNAWRRSGLKPKIP
jgi:hypothetical protein